MNTEDRARFARYRPGYIDHPSDEELESKKDSKDSKDSKDNTKVGYVEKIDINQDDLINKVLREFEANQTNKNSKS
jgi:hypothetical protein